METYLSVLLALLTYKFIKRSAKSIGLWIGRQLPKLGRRWNYNLNGDLCVWDDNLMKRVIVGVRILRFLGFK